MFSPRDPETTTGLQKSLQEGNAIAPPSESPMAQIPESGYMYVELFYMFTDGGEGAVGLDRAVVGVGHVGRKRTGLVGAKNGGTSQLLCSSDTGDDGLVSSELLGTDGEGDGQDSGHGDGDTTD